MDPRKTAILRVLEGTKHFDGNRVDGGTILQLIARQKNAGLHVIEGPLRDILDSSTHATVQRAVSTGCYADGLEECVPVAGFGSIFGEAVVATLSESKIEHHWSIDWTALWNLLVVYFDEICDEYGSLVPVLLDRMSPAKLRKALHPDSNERLMPEPEDPVLLRFVLEIADAVFSRFRSLAKCVSASDFFRLARIIEKAYLGEIKTARLYFSDLQDTEDLHKHLRAAGTLPVWIPGCLAAYATGFAPLPKKLGLSLGYIGDVFWLLDDLIDLENDVTTDRWNAIFLLAAECHRPSILPKLRQMSPDDRLIWLYENELQDVLAERVSEALRLAIETLDSTFGKGTPMARDLLSTLWSFANEISNEN